MKRMALVLLAALVVGSAMRAVAGGTRPSFHERSPGLRLAMAALQGRPLPRLPNGSTPPLPSSAVLSVIRQGASPEARGHAVPAFPKPSPGTVGCPNVFRAPGLPDNVRANQDCGFQRQAEEWIAVNPNDPANVVVSQNDTWDAGNHTGVDFSTDRGLHLGDSRLPTGRIVIPNAPGGQWSFDAFSDPWHAFDSRGNLFYVAIGFDFAQDSEAGVFVWKSNACLKASALHAPGSGSCDPFRPPTNASAVPVHTTFDDPMAFDDKGAIAADRFASSPYRDRLYVTWTLFGPRRPGVYWGSPIMLSRSVDGGVTWSRPVKISGSNPAICAGGEAIDPAADPGACNADQASFPVVGPDGSVSVAFNNCNVPPQESPPPCQQLVVRSSDGGATWSQPVRVSLDYDLQPQAVPGHPIPGCFFFVPCLPPNGYSVDDDPSMGVGADGMLAVFWSDFRNGGPCAFNQTYHVPVEPCANHDNDVFVSTSSNGGVSWGPARLVTAGGQAAQWQAAGTVEGGGRLDVAYYDRGLGCESSGCNDITLARSSDGGLTWTHRRVTTDSMPNLTCENNPDQCGFLGDYMSIDATGTHIFLAWSDTRGRGLPGYPEEDVYLARLNR
jgi:hypothetical protein